MEMQEYLKLFKDIHKYLIDFIDHGKTIIIDDQFKKILDDPKVKEDKYNLKTVSYLILAIANQHHRYSDFFGKLEKILLLLKENIIQKLSNSEIFNIFKSNKRLLLFVIKEKFLNIDQTIIEAIQKEAFLLHKYQVYFFPEIKASIDANLKKEILSKVQDLSSQNFGVFEHKRNIGENDNQICELIRNDSIDEFVAYLKKTNTPVSFKIPQSIFETHSFLLDNDPTLIEYSAFFGSIQIFKYLQSNGAQLSPSLWLYAIHGNNLEILNILKESQIKPKDATYKECLNESIKCHHNEITKFIQASFLQNQNDSDFVNVSSAKYCNYDLLSNDTNSINFFYLLCQNENAKLVEILLKKADIKSKINTIMVFN